MTDRTEKGHRKGIAKIHGRKIFSKHVFSYALFCLRTSASYLMMQCSTLKGSRSHQECVMFGSAEYARWDTVCGRKEKLCDKDPTYPTDSMARFAQQKVSISKRRSCNIENEIESRDGTGSARLFRHQFSRMRSALPNTVARHT